MSDSAWFDSWESLFNILISSLTGYIILIIYIRIAGKRATSKLNNFDWIVTVAMGSIFASMVILKDVTVANGAFAMALLLLFQFLLTKATFHWEWARIVFLARPSILYGKDEFQTSEMQKNRVSKGEILSAIREHGVGTLDEVHVILLEPDAELSVVKKIDNQSVDTVESIAGYQELMKSD